MQIIRNTKKKEDIMELPCPSIIMDMVVKSVYAVIKLKKNRDGKQGSAFAKQGCYYLVLNKCIPKKENEPARQGL